MPMSVAAIIVAAGSSSRLGEPKQLVMIHGEPMLQRMIRFVNESGTSPVFVVLGANREVIQKSVDFGSSTIVINREWEEGLASSIRAGLRAVEVAAPDAAGVLLMSCDQPRVTAEHLRRMIKTFLAQSQPAAIASAYAEVVGVPAIFPRVAIPDLRALRGDKGARQLFVEPPWPVVPVPLEGGEVDIDSPDDLAQLY